MIKQEITHEGFRWMTFYDFKEGLTWQECLVSLHKIFASEAVSEKTVYIWSAKYFWGCASVSDDSHEGWLKAVAIQNNINAMSKMIEDRHITYCETKASLDISQTAIHLI